MPLYERQFDIFGISESESGFGGLSGNTTSTAYGSAHVEPTDPINPLSETNLLVP
jgi:hypothetical protein